MPPPSLLALAASDTLALAMVAILSFALGMIVTIFFTMIRNSTDHRPDLGPDELFEGEEEDGADDESSRNVGAGDPPKDLKEPWEQDPDWWRR